MSGAVQQRPPLGGWKEDREAQQETWRRVVGQGEGGALQLDVQSMAPASHVWLWRVASAWGLTLAEGEGANMADAQRQADDLAAAMHPERVAKVRALREDLRGVGE